MGLDPPHPSRHEGTALFPPFPWDPTSPIPSPVLDFSKALIVLPTYNEVENIDSLVHTVFSLYPEIRVLVVDDHSPDGTGARADALAGGYPGLQVLHRPGKMGLGSAYVAGFKRALEGNAQDVFEMDADFSHDPRYIGPLLQAARDADLVIGSRYLHGVRVEGWKFKRLLLSKFANIFVSYMMVRPVWDFTSGFRCYRRELLERLDLDGIRSDGYAFQIEMTYLAFHHGFRVTEIPILFRERARGLSKISREVVREAFWMTLRCRAPLRQILRYLPCLFRDLDHFADQRCCGRGARP